MRPIGERLAPRASPDHPAATQRLACTRADASAGKRPCPGRYLLLRQSLVRDPGRDDGRRPRAVNTPDRWPPSPAPRRKCSPRVGTGRTGVGAGPAGAAPAPRAPGPPAPAPPQPGSAGARGNRAATPGRTRMTPYTAATVAMSAASGLGREPVVPAGHGQARRQPFDVPLKTGRAGSRPQLARGVFCKIFAAAR